MSASARVGAVVRISPLEKTGGAGPLFMRRSTIKHPHSHAVTAIPSVPETPHPSSKKDTKRWCKGVVGREHQGEWVNLGVLRSSKTPQDYASDLGFEWLVCQVCGRHIKLRESRDSSPTAPSPASPMTPRQPR